MKVMVSGNGTSYKNFGADPYMVAPGTGIINYYYWFDEVLNETTPTDHNISSSEPVSITFLGKDIEITDTGANAVTLNMANKYGTSEGGSVTVEGYTVEVGSIFGSSVEVTYAGDTQLISKGSTHDFGPISVKMDDIGQNTYNPELSKAIIYVGKKISDTVSDGETFELFTDYTPDGDAPWKWFVRSTNDDSLTALGITNRLNIDDIDDDDVDMDPVTVGGSIALPNNFAAIQLTEIENDVYDTITITPSDNIDTNGSDSDNTGLIWKCDTGEHLQVGGVDTDTIYLLEGTQAAGTIGCVNMTAVDIWYEDNNGIVTNSTATSFKILNDDTDMTVTWNNGAVTANVDDGYINIAPDSSGTDTAIRLGNFTNATCFEHFGSTEKFETTFFEINYTAAGGSIGGRDYDVRTPYGVIIVDPENNLDSDKVVLKVPNDLQKAKVTVSTSVTSEGSGTEAALMTDDEVGTASDYNLILVGGPCVNSLTAQFLGLSAGSCGAASTFSADTAYLKLKDNGDKVALIVAGWEAADTKRAAKVVANPDSFTLSGTNMTVTGTSLEVSGITVV